MKIYKQNGLTSYAPKKIKLNKSEIGVLSKTKSGHIHMDFYHKNRGPDGSSIEFAGNLLSSVLNLLK